jgi:hypothetical protein
MKTGMAGLAPVTKGCLSPCFIYEQRCSEARFATPRTSIARVFHGSGKSGGKNHSKRGY